MTKTEINILGKYKPVIPDILEGEAYDKNWQKLKGVFKKVNPKATIGEKIYDKNGKQLDGTYKNLENDTKGEELFDKNKKKLAGTYKK